MPASRTARVSAVAMLAAAVAGCGSASPASALSGSLTVLAAASLATAFTSAGTALESADPGFTVTFSFGGSQQLVQNVVDGAPADVVATADTTTMQRLVTAHLVSTPRTFAHNVLEIAVAPGNPKHIESLAGLASPGVNVVLADPSVPAGAYAVQALHKAGVAVTPRSLELSVTSALEKVESGDADAAIVYVTDVAAAQGKVTGVAISAADNVVATYVVAAIDASPRAAAAQAFVDDVLSGRIHAELLQRGFLPP